jgi:hypothetical protein
MSQRACMAEPDHFHIVPFGARWASRAYAVERDGRRDLKLDGGAWNAGGL